MAAEDRNRMVEAEAREEGEVTSIEVQGDRSLTSEQSGTPRVPVAERTSVKVAQDILVIQPSLVMFNNSTTKRAPALLLRSVMVFYYHVNTSDW